MSFSLVRVGLLHPRSLPAAIFASQRLPHHRTKTTISSHPKRVFEGGSVYENYNATSKTYDDFRKPIGLEIIREGLASLAVDHGMRVDELKLLDAGCGSGNYLEVLQNDVGSINGLEFNEGMIEQARKKLGDDVIRQGSILELPFSSSTFDVVLTTQVLHHLDPQKVENGAPFPNINRACQEVSRALRPGGAWMISTQTPQQHLDGFWWTPIVPEAAETLAYRFPTLEDFRHMLFQAGFDDVQSYIPVEPMIELDKYLDMQAPFKEGFRNADSTWSLAMAEDLERGLAWWQQKIDSDEAEGYLSGREALRSEVGQTTTVIARKAWSAREVE